MADRLSVSGNFVGIVSLGITALEGLITYCSALKYQNDDIISVNTQLHRLLQIFNAIKTRMDETKNPLPLEKCDDIESTLKECYTEVKELDKKLQAIRALDQPKGSRAKIKVRFMRLLYPFDEKDTVVQIKKMASGLNGHIVAIARVLQIDVPLEMNTTMHNVQGNIQKFHCTNQATENDRYLEKLSRVKGAAFDCRRLEHSRTCLQGTRVGLLNEIMEWCRSSADKPCIYWLCGMAGTGKSTIARTVSMACDNEKRLGASFFFSKADEHLKKAQYFVTTIAFQLAEHIPGLKPLMSEVIKKKPDICYKSLEIQWKHLIADPLSSLDQLMLEGFVVIMDALDECEKDDDIKLILRVLAQANELGTTRLKVFITSRPETPIREVFGDTTMITHQLQILHNVPEKEIYHDIALYFQDKLKDDITPGDLDRLVERAGGLFIWAATACQFLKGAPAMKERRLDLLLTNGESSQNPEKELDRIYTSILSSSMKDKYHEVEYEEVFKQYRRIVGAIILVSNPVPMDTLSRLLRLSTDAINDIIGDLHSVLDIPADDAYPIRILHLSFRDFLLSRSRCPDNNVRIEELQGHRSLLSECLRCMSEKLRENMCELPYPGFSSGDLKKEIVEKALPSDLQYACRYWIYHLQRSGNEVCDDRNVEMFLQIHFLHWLEALSLMGAVSEGIDAIRALESKVSSEDNEGLYKLSQDARCFITKHRNTIEDAPLQTYSSALIFSPTGSIIRQKFAKKIPPWIKTPPVVQEIWDPLVQTLEGHYDQVETLTFSADGKTLASGSSDKTVRLWDPVTGALHRILEGHSDSVLTLAFSPDGNTLASGSFDNTVRLWDPATGTLRGTLEGHSNSVKTLAFSPDGNTLASGSWDYTIRLWDPATGASRGTLEGHSSGVNTLAFSPDGKTIASGSWDYTVRLWNLTTGALCGTLEGHSGSVFTLAFSLDGKTLASGSFDNTIRLWDPATGASHETLECRSDWVQTLVFSPDGKFLADRQSSNDPINPWGIKGSWITHEQHNMLFLPVDVRPRCCSIHGTFVAWGDVCGSVYTMELRSYQPPINSIHSVNAGTREV